MPEILIVRAVSSVYFSAPATFKVLLQRRSALVKEGINWGLPGGSYEDDERHALRAADVFHTYISIWKA